MRKLACLLSRVLLCFVCEPLMTGVIKTDEMFVEQMVQMYFNALEKLAPTGNEHAAGEVFPSIVKRKPHRKAAVYRPAQLHGHVWANAVYACPDVRVYVCCTKSSCSRASVAAMCLRI